MPLSDYLSNSLQEDAMSAKIIFQCQDSDWTMALKNSSGFPRKDPRPSGWGLVSPVRRPPRASISADRRLPDLQRRTVPFLPLFLEILQIPRISVKPALPRPSLRPGNSDGIVGCNTKKNCRHCLSEGPSTAELSPAWPTPFVNLPTPAQHSPDSDPFASIFPALA